MTISRERVKEEALDIFLAAVAAASPEEAVKRALGRFAEEIGSFRRVFVVSIGKAAIPMAAAAKRALSDRVAGGVAVTKYGHGGRIEGITVVEAGHPLPDEQGVSGAQMVLDMVTGKRADDLILVLISGGGSALMTLPAVPLTLTDLIETNRLLIGSTADIYEINTVRKHLSGISGGRLAVASRPARVISLIISDVVGDDIAVIASGPTAPDPSTFSDARKVLSRHGIENLVPRAVSDYLAAGAGGVVSETPKPDNPAFDMVTNLVVAGAAQALSAAQERAVAIGYRPLVLSSCFTGDTHELASFHAAVAGEALLHGRPIEPPACLISGGETTLTVSGGGKGGRNTEFALSFARYIQGMDGVFGLFCGSDGTDGPTDAAGAFASSDTIARARERGLDPERYLSDNDSYSFFQKLDDLIVTGPTRTNVMDIRLVLITRGGRP